MANIPARAVGHIIEPVRNLRAERMNGRDPLSEVRGRIALLEDVVRQLVDGLSEHHRLHQRLQEARGLRPMMCSPSSVRLFGSTNNLTKLVVSSSAHP